MFYVYAIYNQENNKIYIGQTNNLKRRILEHNSKDFNRSYWTSKFSGKWKLIYCKELSSRKEVILIEKQLKSHKGRRFIRGLIKD
ncbi:MAG: GIY-YIG nuclease family protein [Candidatus Aenigmarchaeota archaeon]|nr:GIY-YIG nuclease family protein [Candidatus Aenigmarchaeota archaeon]